MAKAKSPNKKVASANGHAGANGTATVSKKNVYRSVSEDRIRRRAYELYTQRGGSHGGHREDWFRAEAELSGRR